jgi:hypothetical protein
VIFADGEKSVILHGYSDRPVHAEASGGKASLIDYDKQTSHFRVEVNPAADGREVVVSIAPEGPLPPLN